MSETATLTRPAAQDRALRRADRRGRDIRGRRRLSPDQAVPRHQLRGAGDAGELRRHVVDPQISGHPVRQRPPHLRLPLQAVDQRADRDRGRNPRLHGRSHRGERPRPPHPLSSQDQPRPAGRAQEKLWTIEATRTDTGEAVRFTANFLWMCQGYYRHSEGYTPEWDGMETFKGRIVHPQTWPEDLDYKGKNVVVIGSGATAATLVPAIAADCAHVTMLQRSPTYFRTGRNAIALAEELRALRHRRGVDPRDRPPKDPVRAGRVHPAVVHRTGKGEAGTAGRRARLAGAGLRRGDAFHAELPAVAAADRVRSGWRFVQGDRVRQSLGRHRRDRAVHRNRHPLKSGKALEADIIITATGFHLNVLGDIAFTIDGAPLVFSETVTYRGMMFTGIPNMAWVFGYFRASWTLRSDLVADFVCRLLNHMKQKGARSVVPALRPEDKDMPLLPWIDPENFNRATSCAACICCRNGATTGMAAHPGLLDGKGRMAGHRPG